MNPVPYNQLFDIDGLNAAVKEATEITDEYGNEATAVFKQIGTAAASLRKELEKINATINGKPIRLTDESGQAAVVQYAKDVSELTNRIKEQDKTIATLTSSLNQNKQAIADAKLAAAEFAKEQQNLRAQQEATKLSIAQQTLFLTENKAAVAASNLSNQQYITTLKQQQAAEQATKVKIAETTLAMRQLTLSQREASAAAKAVLSPYQELSKELNTQRNAAKDIAITKGLNSPEFKEAAKNVNELDTKLKAVDSTLGQSQRNVGNYGSALTKFYGYIRTAANILPGIGISGIFLLAFDGITKAAESLGLFTEKLSYAKALLASYNEVNKSASEEYGKQATTLRILYTAATDVTNSQQDRLLAAKELQKEFPATFKNLQTEAILNGSVKDSYDELSKSILESAKARAAVSKIESLTAKNQEAEFQKIKIDAARQNELDQDAAQRAQNAKNYAAGSSFLAPGSIQERANTQSILDRAAAAYKVQNDIIKINNQQIDFFTKFAGGNNQMAKSLSSSNDTVIDAQSNSIAAIRKQISELEKLKDSSVKGSDTYNKIKELQAQLKDLLGTAKATKEGFALLEEQLQKVKVALEESIIADKKRNYGRNTAETIKLADAYNKLTYSLQQLKQAQAGAEITAQFGNAPLKATTTSPSVSDQATGIAGALLHSDVTAAVNSALDALGKIDDGYAETNKKILASYKAKNITILQYDAEMLKSEQKQQEDDYNLQRDILEKQAQLAIIEHGKGSKEYSSYLKQIDALDKSHNEKQLENDRKQYENIVKQRQAVLGALGSAASAVGSVTGSQGITKLLNDAGNNIVNGFGGTDLEKFQSTAQLAMDATQTYTDFAINASKQRQAALEAEMQYEITGAGNNAEAKKAIEVEYTKRIRDEKTKQAKLAKAAAAVDIIVNTAVAVAKVAAQTGIFAAIAAPAIAALGAIELGIVLAQPIPQYAGGRFGGKGEVAEVNERGAELIGKAGKYRFANKGQRGYTYLRPGENVIPADTTQHLINSGIVQSEQAAQEVSRTRDLHDTYIMAASSNKMDYLAMGEQFTKAVSNMPFNNAVFDENGVSRFTQKNGQRRMSVRNRNSL